jgi:hypothetical protein
MFKRTTATLLAFLTVMVGSGGASALAGQGDTRVPLIRDPSNNCERGADAIPGTGSSTNSFVVVHPAGQNTLGVEVVLRDAEPDATYNVFLIQVIADPGELGTAPDCLTQDATLTTNAQGSGIVHLSEERLAEATFFHVYLYSFAGGFHKFDTERIAFP